MVRVYTPNNPRQKPYTEDELNKAVKMIQDGLRYVDVLPRFDNKIPGQTLRDRVKKAERGEELKRPGRRSTLGPAVEKKLAQIISSRSEYSAGKKQVKI